MTDLESVIAVYDLPDKVSTVLSAGEFDAIVLATAGLNRLQLDARITQHFAVEDMLPAGGQGALGVECADDNDAALALLAPLRDDAVAERVTAERAVAAGLGADCTMPLGAHALPHERGLELRAVLAHPDGTGLIRAQATGTDAAQVASSVVQSLREQGATEILEALSGAH